MEVGELWVVRVDVVAVENLLLLLLLSLSPPLPISAIFLSTSLRASKGSARMSRFSDPELYYSYVCRSNQIFKNYSFSFFHEASSGEWLSWSTGEHEGACGNIDETDGSNGLLYTSKAIGCKLASCHILHTIRDDYIYIKYPRVASI